MSDTSNFAGVLKRYVERLAYTPGQLARLSNIPEPTIINWLKGRVKKPRRYTDLVRVAAALRLSEGEASELLQSAGHPPSSQGSHAKTLQPVIGATWTSRPLLPSSSSA